MKKAKTEAEIIEDNFMKFLDEGANFGELIHGEQTSSNFNAEDPESVAEAYKDYSQALKKVFDALEKIKS